VAVLQPHKRVVEFLAGEEPMIDQEIQALLERGPLVVGEEFERGHGCLATFTKDFNEEAEGVINASLGMEVGLDRMLDPEPAHGASFPAPACTSSRSSRRASVANIMACSAHKSFTVTSATRRVLDNTILHLPEQQRAVGLVAVKTMPHTWQGRDAAVTGSMVSLHLCWEEL
jgi:hypothetical protein